MLDVLSFVAQKMNNFTILETVLVLFLCIYCGNVYHFPANLRDLNIRSIFCALKYDIIVGISEIMSLFLVILICNGPSMASLESQSGFLL